MFAFRDVELPGDDKPRYVGTIMWRNKSKFLNVEGRGYWLRNSPVPRPASSKDQVMAEYDVVVSKILRQDRLFIDDHPMTVSDTEYENLQRIKGEIERRNPDLF